MISYISRIVSEHFLRKALIQMCIFQIKPEKYL